MTNNCPTCSAAHERHRERDAAANAEWTRAWDAAWTEYEHVLDAHPQHAEVGP